MRYPTRLLIKDQLLRKKIWELANELFSYYKQQLVSEVVVVGLLNSSYAFLGELTEDLEYCIAKRSRRRRMELLIDHLVPHKGQQMLVRSDISVDITGRHVLVVDALMRTGRTLLDAVRFLQHREPRSMRAAVMLKKDCAVEVEFPVPLHYATVIPDVLVAGKGLDYQGLYRALPHIVEILS